MPNQIHEFPVTIEWSGGREGHGKWIADSLPEAVDLAVPVGFQGPGGATNPEELLTGAIAGCFSITFGIVAANRKLPIVNVQTQAIGVVEQAGASFVYKSIAVRPTITLAADATDAQIATATEMAHKTDAYCIVTNAIRGKVEVTIEPNVVRA